MGTWMIRKKLSEIKRMTVTPFSYDPNEEQEWDPSEAYAVYDCIQIEGSQVGMQAILKIRIQYASKMHFYEILS